MSNVIQVEFGKKNVTQEVPGTDTASSLTAYLDSLREKGIDDEDILETIDAINNVDAYFAADDEVKTFADGWLHQFL
jgi:hypothetical protein